MNINETSNFSANITLKDTNNADTVVAYLTASLDGSTNNMNINMNVTNKVLLCTADATNVAGETVTVQYTDFQTLVTARAKELGYTIFA